MAKQEFLLLIPAIIYGVAIVDLLKIFQHKNNYIEMVSWGIYVMMLVIFSWTELYNKLELITNSTLNFFRDSWSGYSANFYRPPNSLAHLVIPLSCWLFG